MNGCRRLCSLSVGLISTLLMAGTSLGAKQVDPVVHFSSERGLSYVTDARGNRVPDFSFAGYGGGGVEIPRIAPTVSVEPIDGEDGARLQAILDAVAEWPVGDNGLRAVVYLEPGVFELEDGLEMRASGVVLRGSGADAGGTVLRALRPGREPVISVQGKGDWTPQGSSIEVDASYVPVGAMRLPVASAANFAVGQNIRITRPSTDAWIEAVGMEEAPARTPYKWRAGQWDMFWDREIVGIEGDTLVLDAPLTTALEARFGGATVQAYTWAGRLRDVGVENLRIVAEVDPENPQDEEHAWIGVQLDAVQDAWVAGVTSEHLVSSLVDVTRRTRRVTAQDCRSLQPVSELAGYRRISFHTRGQQTLFLRCYAEDGMHDFVAGNLTTGPNVFLECHASDPHGWSGSIGSWASGMLFDNVDIDGNALSFDNLGIWNQGVGWSAANSMVWQSTASYLIVRSPPTAVNWADGVWAQFEGDGLWMHTSEFTNPQSLYREQLHERVGRDGVAALEPLGTVRDGAMSLAKAIPDLGDRLLPQPPPPGRELTLSNGWLTADGALLFGREQSITWWRGSVVPNRAPTLGPSVTRFVPGMRGLGLTDDLDELTDTMVAENKVVLRHHYGLWYDRRRDDHERTRRISADVWPPFYELPWARMGQGEAWNRLTRYDLTKYNPWFFDRLQTFAEFSRQKGLVLINEMYFQHNIIESGAHWVDFPWRPANAVQPTGFTEPPPFTGDTIKMADEFYDLSHPQRREWHRLFIRKCLENLADEPNVIHTISAEFTGPRHFVEFWLDVIAEWQAETGHDPLIAISATKDVQDAVLANPNYAPLIDVIDFTYWYRTPEGDEFAPEGGISLAPRQNMRLWRGGRANALSLAGMAAEYRARFPEKAVITGWGEADGWAWAAAGGSFPNLPPSTDPALLAALAAMSPVAASSDAWVLGNDGKAFFGFSANGTLTFDLREITGTFEIREVNLRRGTVSVNGETVQGGDKVEFQQDGAQAKWLVRIDR